MIRKNSLTMREAIDEMVNKFKLRPKINEQRIKDSWQRVMGNVIAKHTSQVSLKGGKLYLKVDSASLKNDLTYSKDKIKELFNEDFNETVITEVVIY